MKKKLTSGLGQGMWLDNICWSKAVLPRFSGFFHQIRPLKIHKPVHEKTNNLGF